VDTLRLAADEGDRSRQINCKWTVVAPTMDPVRSSCGVELATWETLGDPARFDYIVVVGGLLSKRIYDPTTLQWIRAAAAGGRTLIGLCVGTFALLRAGVMDGRKLCINAYHVHDLREQFPGVKASTDQWFTVDRDRITSPGGVAAADVAAFLVKRHCGEVWARKGLQLAMISEPKSPSHPQPVAATGQAITHVRLRRAVAMIEQQLWQPPTLQQLSARAHLSTRQLQRLFNQHLGCGPHEFSRKVRLRYGLWLLKRTDRSVNDIAESCGFRDPPHFCRRFRELFGMSPLQARSADPQDSDALQDENAHLPWQPELNVYPLRVNA
jgi:transcriptional regulator GlxA family with amidase domain